MQAQDKLITSLQAKNETLTQRLSEVSLQYDSALNKTEADKKRLESTINKLQTELHSLKAVPAKKLFSCRYCDIKQIENENLIRQVEEYESFLQKKTFEIEELLQMQSDLSEENLQFLDELRHFAVEKSNLDVMYNEQIIKYEQVSKELVEMKSKLLSKDCHKCLENTAKQKEMEKRIIELQDKMSYLFQNDLKINNEIPENELLKVCNKCHQQLVCFPRNNNLSFKSLFDITCGHKGLHNEDQEALSDKISHQIDHLIQQNHYLYCQNKSMDEVTSLSSELLQQYELNENMLKRH